MALETQNTFGGEQLAPERASAGLPWRLMVFSLVLFSFSIFVYFGIHYGYSAFLDAQSTQLSKDAATLDKKISEQSSSQDSYLGLYSRLYNLNTVLQNRSFLSNVFPLLEKYAVADVYYSNLTYSKENKTFSVHGIAKSFDALSQQVSVFEQGATAQVSAVSVKNVSVSERGVDFDIVLTLAPSFVATQRDTL